jgi:hypothetical protein
MIRVSENIEHPAPFTSNATYNRCRLKAPGYGIALRGLEWLCAKEHRKTMNDKINLQTLGVIFKYGDITEVTSVDCIAQQCNCLTVHSHGLGKRISEKYPWINLHVYERRQVVQNRNLAIPEDSGTGRTVEIMKSPQPNIPDVMCLFA